MDHTQIGSLIIVIILIGLSAVFSSSETAFNCLNGIRIKNLAKEGNRKAERAYKVYKDQTAALTTILIGNNIVNILATAIATSLFEGLLPDYGIFLATIVMTVVVLIFGEITPKVFAQSRPEQVAMRNSGFMLVLMAIFRPLSFVVVKGQQKWDSDEEKVTATEDELLEIVNTIEQEGVLEQEERELIESVIDFDDTTIRDVMVPRDNVVWLYDNASWPELKKLMQDNKLSRFPVIDHSTLNVIGILRIRDVLEKLLKDEPVVVRDLCSEANCVSQWKKLPSVLEEIQKNREHMLIVEESSKSDNFVGVVTLEDILEELVGEIYDEYDPLPDHVVEYGHHTFEIEGKVNLQHFFDEYLEDETPPLTQARTIALWVYELAGAKKVRKGKELEYENYEIKVLETKDGLAKRIELTVNTALEED